MVVGTEPLRDPLDGSAVSVGVVGAADTGTDDPGTDDTGDEDAVAEDARFGDTVSDDCVSDDCAAPVTPLALDAPAAVLDPTCAVPATVEAQPTAKTVTAVANAAITDARLIVPTTLFTHAWLPARRPPSAKCRAGPLPDENQELASSASSRFRVRAGSTGIPGPMVVAKETFFR